MTFADLLPAAPVQKQMWVVDRMDPAAAIYNEDLAFWIDGPLDADALREAWRVLTARHEALRYVFHTGGGDLRLSVAPEADVTFRTADCTDDDAALAWGTALVQERYDITARPPLRFGLARVRPDRHLLVIGFHHAVVDAGSLGLLVEELGAAYTAARAGRKPDLPPVGRTYADFIRGVYSDEHRRRVDALLPEAVARLTADGGATSAELPSDRPRPPVKSPRGRQTAVDLPDGIVTRLRHFAAEHRVTPFHVLLAGMTALLRRCTGLDDMVFGVGTSGRPPGFEQAVGPFACFVPVRVRTPGSARFTDLLDEARSTAFDLADAQFVPFSEVVSRVVTSRDPSRSPLVQIVFNAPPLVFRDDVLAGCALHLARLPRTRSRVDLLVNVGREGDGLVAGAEFDDSLYDEPTITTFLDQLGHLVDVAMRQPDTCVDDLPLPGLPARPAGDGGNRTRPESRAAGADPVTSGSRVERHLVQTCRELLEDPAVAAADDFFVVGGHSMLAARLVQRLGDEFDIDLPLLMVFEHPVLAELAAEIEAQFPHVDEVLARVEQLTDDQLADLGTDHEDTGAATEAGAVTGLSGHEQPFWLMEQFAPASAVNTLTLRIRGAGGLDLAAFEEALRRVVDREEILRTSYHADDDLRAVRRVHDAVPVTVDVAHTDAAGADRLAREEATRGFDITRAPLMRCTVVFTGGDDFELLFSFHHLVMDYWAVTRVMLPALSAFYAERVAGVPARLEPPHGYREAILREEEFQAGPRARAERDYWRTRLDGVRPAEFRTDRERRDDVDFRGAFVTAEAGPDLAARIDELVGDRRGTLFAVVAAAVAATARRWSDRTDVAFMAPAENRRTDADTRVMGTFVNLITLRYRFDQDLTWNALVEQSRHVTRDAYAHQSVPVGVALADAGLHHVIASGQGRYLVLNVFSDDTGLDLHGCRIGGGAIVAHDCASTDLELSVLHAGGRLHLSLKYRPDLWERDSAERICADVLDALHHIVADGDAPVAVSPSPSPPRASVSAAA